MKISDRKLSHYRNLIQIAKDSKYQIGLCIIMGEVAYGTFFVCPWCYWNEMVKYYPLLDVYKPPKYPSTCYQSHQRKMIVESLRLRLNKKKDIYRNKVYKK